MPLNGTYEPSRVQWVREQVELYASSGGRQGTTLRDTRIPVVFTSRGARSGALRKPVMRVEYAAGVASEGGAREHPVWYHDMLADPHVEVQDGPRTQDMTARLLNGAERQQWWDRAVAVPSYAGHQRKTEREIPVFLLEPVT